MLSSYKLSIAGRVMQQTKLPARILVASGFTLPARPWRYRFSRSVFGHAEFANGTEIVTNPLWLIIRTETADLAYTNNAVYELCAAHPDLIAAFLEPD
jgi:hypothetical protein